VRACTLTIDKQDNMHLSKIIDNCLTYKLLNTIAQDHNIVSSNKFIILFNLCIK